MGQALSNALLESAQLPFNIIEEFSALSPKRKVLLCEHVFLENDRTFKNTVCLLWPESSNADIKKLKNFLILLRRNALH